MRVSTLLVLLAMAIGLSVLCSLGLWQLERLSWKENLVTTISRRIDDKPLPLDEVLRLSQSGNDIEYMPVMVSGTFDHGGEVYFYATDHGAVGWHIYTPFNLEGGRILIVNRGFVPDSLKDPATRQPGQTAGLQEITGLARKLRFEKPNSFVPDNAPEIREFYWRSHTQMAGLMANGRDMEFVAFFVDAAESAMPGGWPRGGATLISFPNNHLQYAFTWFGLALALLGVGGYFLYARRADTNR